MNKLTKEISVFTMTVIILAILFYNKPPSEEISDDETTDQSFPELIPSGILSNTTGIDISDSNKGIQLDLSLNDRNEWITPSHQNAHIDMKKLMQAIRVLTKTKITRLATHDPERIKQLELNQQTILFKNENDQPLRKLSFGKKANKQTRFIQINDMQEVFIIDQPKLFNFTISNWIDKHPLRFKEEKVASITFNTNRKPITFERISKDSPFQLNQTDVMHAKLIVYINEILNTEYTKIIKDNEVTLDKNDQLDNITFKLFSGDSTTLNFAQLETKETQRPVLVNISTGAHTDIDDNLFLYDAFLFKLLTRNPDEFLIE